VAELLENWKRKGGRGIDEEKILGCEKD